MAMRGGRRVGLVYRTSFDAAHYLPGYYGPCGNLHGHRWELVVYLSGDIDEKTGMLLDFNEIKAIVNSTLPDHRLLNDLIANPTAEEIAFHLWREIEWKLPDSVALERIELWETPNQGVIYEG